MIPPTTPFIEIASVTKQYGGPDPLRIQRLDLEAHDRVALSGLDAGAAETLLNLITGASVPDEGTIKVAGADTRDIATDTDWLNSLDRFGIVTARAVLIGALPIAANLALPLTLSIDPMSAVTRSTVESLARAVDLPLDRLDAAVSTATPVELIRIHLARALAPRPRLLLLEHPTRGLGDPAVSRHLGGILRRVADSHSVGWLAVSDDQELAGAAGARRLKLKPSTGEIVSQGFWQRWVRQS
jgi:ABC-type transporter Mla maintaining outer membrane lipid asymmetry ATPase subunit MlaF